MTQTYDEILTRMKKRFYEESGEDPDNSGEILVRLEAVAAEVFSLYTFGDFIARQAFAETAEGEYLDKTGALFNLARKSATAAAGEVTFTAAEDAQSAITIDRGTAVCASAAPYIQYFTDETVTIPAGSRTANVTVTAAQPGTKHNRPAGFIDTVVNPPGSVAGVTNSGELSGGFAAEDDAHFRARILDVFSQYMNGYNSASIRATCMRIDGVRDCRVSVPEEKTLQITMRMENDKANDLEFMLEFLTQFSYLEMFGVTLHPVIAEKEPYDLGISLGVLPYSTPNTQETMQRINEMLLQLNGTAGLEESLPLQKIKDALLQLEGVEDCCVQCSAAVAGVLPCPSGKYIQLNTVEEVTFYAV